MHINQQALITKKNPPGQLVSFWLENKFTLVTSQQQLEEIKRVLNYEHLLALIKPIQIRDFLNNIEGKAFICKKALPFINDSPDPDDNIIIATAVVGQANFIVSGDKRDMLFLNQVKGIRIVTARQTLVLLSDLNKVE